MNKGWNILAIKIKSLQILKFETYENGSNSSQEHIKTQNEMSSKWCRIRLVR